ncbi:MAG: hypothetical protein IJC45_05835 [Clostridia bacterium]|nr:hypothetical protein [Clostridia bacterium]
MLASLLHHVDAEYQQNLPIIFWVLNASFFVLLVPVLVWIGKSIYFHKAKNSRKPITNKMLLLTSVCLVLSVACLRYCTFLYKSEANENVFELIVNSLLQGLRGLAVDEEYVEVLDTGKTMIDTYFPQSEYAKTAFSIMYNMTNILTPVFGGAFLFNAIIKFLPRLKLSFSFYRKQYYFSELNDRSLALATSIADQKIIWYKRWYKKPLLVFTDTYVDEDSEKSNELYQAAKRIGAICISDDIVHFHVPSCREKWFFLMDENEIDNIHALAAFAAEAKPAHIRSSQVFVFYQNDAYALTEKRILDSLDDAVRRKYKKSINRKADKQYKTWLFSREEELRERAYNKLHGDDAVKKKIENDELASLKKWVNAPENKKEYAKWYEEKYKMRPTVAENGQDAFEKECGRMVEWLRQDSNKEAFTAWCIKKEDELREDKKKDILKNAVIPYAPVITRVRDYENLIFLLLRDVPLFAPLLLDEIAAAKEKEEQAKKQAQETAEQNTQEKEASPSAMEAEQAELTVAADQQKVSQLNVTILGSGQIGMQMLLSSSWCGQIYGHSLGLNMVSEEDDFDVLQRIQQLSPEFMQSTVKNTPLLRIFAAGRDEEYNEPYFTFRYAKADLDKRDFAGIDCVAAGDSEDTHNMLDSDYYVVALGSDEQNISTAELLARSIAVRKRKTGNEKNVVIVMMVFDPKICDLFKNATEKDEFSKEKIHIYPFGSLEFIYSIENITLVRDNPSGVAMNSLYSGIFAEQTRHLSEDRSRQKKVYDAWSSLARAFHLNYRVYSAHRFLQECEEYSTLPPLLTDVDITTETYSAYNRLVIKKQKLPPQATAFEKLFIMRLSEKKIKRWKKLKAELKSDKNKLRMLRFVRTHVPAEKQEPMVLRIKERFRKEKNEKDNPDYISGLGNYLTWLEHRRWNAYVRSIGFICNENPGKKEMALKLHNCLVECAHEPYCVQGTSSACADCRFRTGCTGLNPVGDDGKVIPVPDRLDVVSATCKWNYKVYDRPDDMESDLEKNIAAVNKILNRKKT